ncbi:Hypothetical protein KVN_LOCUS94 [uncultured virus]|nr:Hypothetical protein KVN_LOCUS94 [uncultured virus]
MENIELNISVSGQKTEYFEQNNQMSNSNEIEYIKSYLQKINPSSNYVPSQKFIQDLKKNGFKFEINNQQDLIEQINPNLEQNLVTINSVQDLKKNEFKFEINNQQNLIQPINPNLEQNLVTINSEQTNHSVYSNIDENLELVNIQHYDQLFQSNQVDTLNDCYINITPLLNLSQNMAAKKIGIPSSTLSKRFRESRPKEKWPYRKLCKIEKEMISLILNVKDSGSVDSESAKTYFELQKQRNEHLKSTIIRINKNLFKNKF